MKDFQIPDFGIKITRRGDKLKLKVGKYELELLPLEGETTQTYSLLALDSFVTSTATKLLQAEVKKQQEAEAFRNSFLKAADESSDQEFVSRLLEEGEKGKQ